MRKPLAGLLIAVAVAALASTAALAARLPGVKTPTRNIACFYVPIEPTAHGTLLCSIGHAAYARAEQDGCQARAGLDWHGFSLGETTRAQPVCTGGVLYDIGRDAPSFAIIGYGRSWHHRGFTCRSRVTGLTCTNGHGHGLFLSRASFRVW